MKILFIVHQFPPLNKIGTFRIYSFVKEWLKLGYDITILTTKKYTFDGDLNYFPKELKNQNLKIIEVEYAKWFTKKFIVGNHDISKKSQYSNLTSIKSIVRILRKNIIGSTLDIHDLWISSAYKEGIKLMNKEQYDIMFSSFFPPSSHIVASKLKNKYPHIFWVADYRDLWSGNHLIKSNVIINYYTKQLEKRTIKNANMLVTVSEPLKIFLEDFHNKKCYIIENGFDTDELENLDSKKIFPNDGVIRIVYTGSLYYKRRDPTPLFQAIKKLESDGVINEKNFQIIFYGDKNYLEKIVNKLNVEKFVKIEGYVTKELSLKAQRDADALLFLEYENTKENNLSEKGVLTGKLFEYLSSGTEIIAVGITSSTLSGKLIEQSNTGKCYFKNIEELYNVLYRIVKKGKKNIIPNNKIIENYTRSKKAKQLSKIILNEKKMYHNDEI